VLNYFNLQLQSLPFVSKPGVLCWSSLSPLILTDRGIVQAFNVGEDLPEVLGSYGLELQNIEIVFDMIEENGK